MSCHRAVVRRASNAPASVPTWLSMSATWAVIVAGVAATVTVPEPMFVCSSLRLASLWMSSALARSRAQGSGHGDLRATGDVGQGVDHAPVLDRGRHAGGEGVERQAGWP